MFNRIKKLFGKHVEQDPPEIDEVAVQEWYNEKSRFMETILGKEHDMVMHAIIPYAVGGGLDLYYYPHGLIGTGIATKELSEMPSSGSSNATFSCYEIAMFTKHDLSLDDATKSETHFGKAHMNINAILNHIAPYSASATLNPLETCEFPEEMEGVGGKCLVFDAHGEPTPITGGKFGVLTVIEIFRAEMEYARENGSESLFQRLKDEGHYPYSDLERDVVV